jgi:hypothetical protein
VKIRRRGLLFPLFRWYVERLREGRLRRIWFLGDSYTKFTDSTYGTLVYESADRAPDAWRTSVVSQPDHRSSEGFDFREPWRVAKHVPANIMLAAEQLVGQCLRHADCRDHFELGQACLHAGRDRMHGKGISAPRLRRRRA